jgi:hypothetical protein
MPVAHTYLCAEKATKNLHPKHETSKEICGADWACIQPLPLPTAASAETNHFCSGYIIEPKTLEGCI